MFACTNSSEYVPKTSHHALRHVYIKVSYPSFHMTLMFMCQPRIWLYRQLNARVQYLQCISSGDTVILHYAMDMHERPKLGNHFSRQMSQHPPQNFDEKYKFLSVAEMAFIRAMRLNWLCFLKFIVDGFTISLWNSERFSMICFTLALGSFWGKISYNST